VRKTFSAVALVALAASLAACGGSKKLPVDDGTARIKQISFVVDPGWLPKRVKQSIVLSSGPHFQSTVRLIPRPLPQQAKKRPARVCIPATLTIDLSNAQSFDYASCQRPKSFRPLLRSLCKQLRQSRFCDRYRAELGLSPLTK